VKKVIVCELISSTGNDVNVQLSNGGPRLLRMLEASSDRATAITLPYFLKLNLHYKDFFEDVLII
jgi:hypothetical protein